MPGPIGAGPGDTEGAALAADIALDKLEMVPEVSGDAYLPHRIILLGYLIHICVFGVFRFKLMCVPGGARPKRPACCQIYST